MVALRRRVDDEMPLERIVSPDALPAGRSCQHRAYLRSWPGVPELLEPRRRSSRRIRLGGLDTPERGRLTDRWSDKIG
jgi:hypothetical protein